VPTTSDDSLFATGSHAYDYLWYVCGRCDFYNILAGKPETRISLAFYRLEKKKILLQFLIFVTACRRPLWFYHTIIIINIIRFLFANFETAGSGPLCFSRAKLSSSFFLPLSLSFCNFWFQKVKKVFLKYSESFGKHRTFCLNFNLPLNLKPFNITHTAHNFSKFGFDVESAREQTILDLNFEVFNFWLNREVY